MLEVQSREGAFERIERYLRDRGFFSDAVSPGHDPERNHVARVCAPGSVEAGAR